MPFVYVPSNMGNSIPHTSCLTTAEYADWGCRPPVPSTPPSTVRAIPLPLRWAQRPLTCRRCRARPPPSMRPQLHVYWDHHSFFCGSYLLAIPFRLMWVYQLTFLRDDSSESRIQLTAVSQNTHFSSLDTKIHTQLIDDLMKPQATLGPEPPCGPIRLNRK